jgi:thiamine-monophosphate kinase
MPMLTESDICKLLSSLLPSGRRNECFQSDAEIFVLDGKQCLFTTDEFCSEDHFPEDDAFALGWNIAAGAISDILACGGKPLFYAHALTVSKAWDRPFVEQFGQGVAAVLRETAVGFLGGDCGRAGSWRCTPSVIGVCEGKPVLRTGAQPGALLYITGPLGAGNLEAALRLYSAAMPAHKPTSRRLHIRSKESGLVRRYATACTDTSDGLLVSLDALADVNACGYSVEDPPILHEASAFCATTGLSPLLILCGECGEYELLFTVPPHSREELESEAMEQGCKVQLIGRITASGRRIREGNESVTFTRAGVRARDYEDHQSYLDALARQLGIAVYWPHPQHGNIR